jgi:hypothetical protein
MVFYKKSLHSFSDQVYCHGTCFIVLSPWLSRRFSCLRPLQNSRRYIALDDRALFSNIIPQCEHVLPCIISLQILPLYISFFKDPNICVYKSLFISFLIFLFANFSKSVIISIAVLIVLQLFWFFL